MHERRILLLYISEVSGHHNATLAIEKALKQIDHHISILNINSFNYTNPLLERVINRAYMGVIRKAPRIWDYLYDNPRFIRKTQVIKDAVHKSNLRKFEVLFKEFKPTAVVCTQAFPCGLMADYKRVKGVKVPLFGVLTDFLPHAYWFYDEVDYYIVPSHEARQRFIQEGIARERIKLLGIPIDPKFAKNYDRKEIARRLQLEPGVPVILIMGGGQGIGPITHIVGALDKLSQPMQIIVVAGTNKKLFNSLSGKQSGSVKKILVLGYVNNIEELMEVADFIISKPGGLTTAEALAKGLPMIIIRPIPGQEANNTEFLLRHGVAVKIGRLEDIPAQIDALLNNPGKVRQMRENSRKLGNPACAADIAKLILKADD